MYSTEIINRKRKVSRDFELSLVDIAVSKNIYILALDYYNTH